MSQRNNLPPPKRKVPTRPLRLEINDLGIPKSSKHWNHACRVVRMYQDQACNMTIEQQIKYIDDTLESKYYQLDARSENDARFHGACSKYLRRVVGRESLSFHLWLLLHALYEEHQLDEFVASVIGSGLKPSVPASKYNEYRTCHPMDSSLGLIELPPLDQLPMRNPRVREEVRELIGTHSQENGESMSESDADKRRNSDREGNGLNQGPDSTAKRRRVIRPFLASTQPPVISHIQPPNASPSTIANAGRLIGTIGDQITTNGEVIHFLMQRIQILEDKNETLMARVQELESQIAPSSAATGNSHGGGSSSGATPMERKVEILLPDD